MTGAPGLARGASVEVAFAQALRRDVRVRRWIFGASVQGVFSALPRALCRVPVVARSELHLRLVEALARGRRSVQGHPRIFERSMLTQLMARYGPERSAGAFLRGVLMFADSWLRRRCAAVVAARQGADSPQLNVVVLHAFAKCGLHCAGCYTQSRRPDRDATLEELDYVIREASAAGALLVAIAGHGEPLFSEAYVGRLLRVLDSFPWLSFIVYTSGVTMTAAIAAKLASRLNVFVFLSVDGPEEVNDRRRGPGTHALQLNAARHLSDARVPFGFAATVTRDNLDAVLSLEFLREMWDAGCLRGLYCAYTVLDARAPMELALGATELARYRALLEARRTEGHPIADPEIFELRQGCQAKRGSVVFIDAVSGQVAPCVKFPFGAAAANLHRQPHAGRLEEILRSEFFRDFRSNERPCTVDPAAELSFWRGREDLSAPTAAQIEGFASRWLDATAPRPGSRGPQCTEEEATHEAKVETVRLERRRTGE